MVAVALPASSYLQSRDRECYNNPEKWFVRHRWLVHARRRLKKLSRNYLRFFTLPGVECFDVRLFRRNGLVKMNPAGFEDSLAYCEEIAERYTRIGNLLPNARRYQGSYGAFIRVGHAGFTTKADAWFPFDVINLDFSGPGFHQPEKTTSETAESVLKTFRLQKAKRSSFSLFLTLPANPSWNDLTGKTQLQECLDSNLTNSESQEFIDTFRSKYPEYQQNSHAAYSILPYHDFLLTTVPKLMIRYGHDEWFAVTCEDRLTYIGEGHDTRMVSFCFECEYIGLPSGYGGVPQTGLLHSQYLKNISTMIKKQYIDVNQLFASKPRLREKYNQIRTDARQDYGRTLT